MTNSRNANMFGDTEDVFREAQRLSNPARANKGGGFIVRKEAITAPSVDTLSVYEFLADSLVSNGKGYAACVLDQTVKGMTNGKHIEGVSSARGKELVSKRVSREMRSLIKAVDSFINGNPNEYARALFRSVL